MKHVYVHIYIICMYRYVHVYNICVCTYMHMYAYDGWKDR